ncbi:MAG: class I SAM-dependent methyltransferase, partial [Mangrovicoccus sp.]
MKFTLRETACRGCHVLALHLIVSPRGDGIARALAIAFCAAAIFDQTRAPAPPAPAALLQKINHLLPPNAKVLDLACGFGRNGKYLAAQGHKVSFLDKNAEALAEIQQQLPQCEIIEADLECDNPYQLPQNQYDAIVVFRYLHRSLMPAIVNALKPGGIIVYETFNHRQAEIGRPRNPDFLLQDNE